MFVCSFFLIFNGRNVAIIVELKEVFVLNGTFITCSVGFYRTCLMAKLWGRVILIFGDSGLFVFQIILFTAKFAMPANSTEAVADIEESLKSSLQQVTAQSLDARLASSSKKILLHKIDFQPSEKSCSVQFDQLRAKYPPLNPSTAGQRKEKCTANGAPESSKES